MARSDGEPVAGTSPFSVRVVVRWADLDPNHHLSSSRYLDFATHARFAFLSGHGLGIAQMAELGIGPVVFRDEIDYRREVRGGGEVEVTLDLAGISATGDRWRFHQEVVRDDGQVAAVVRSTGAWMDVAARRLTTPPRVIVDAFSGLRHSDDFAMIVPKGR